MATTVVRPDAARLWPVGLVLALPLIGLVVLIAQPELDMAWEHHPSHFWIVLVAAAVNVVLAYVTNVAAGRYRDARLTLISLAFLSSAGFLGLHALATPGVLLGSPNIGFAIATPVGLIIASVFAAASATPLAGPRAMDVLRVGSVLRGGLIAVMVAWAVFSIAQLPPLDGPPPPREGAGVLDVLSVVAVGLFAFAALRLFQVYRYRGDTILLAMAAAVVLLAEALIAMLVSRNWHFSWWEWHLLLLAAFVTIALAARNEYQRRGSLAGAFGGLYLEATLARVERWYATAVASVAAAQASGDATEQVLAELRREGATDDELTLLTQTAHEVGRLDASFRPFLPSVVTERIRHRGHVLAGRHERRRTRGHGAVRRSGRVHAVQRAPRAARGRGDAQRVLGGGRPGRRSCRRCHRAFRGRRRADRVQRSGQPARPRAAGGACCARDPHGRAGYRRRPSQAGRSSGSGSTPARRWSV